MKTLILSRDENDLIGWVQTNYPTSSLLSDDNFNLIKKTDGDFYAFSSSLRVSNLIEAINLSDNVIYYNPKYLTDDKIDGAIRLSDKLVDNSYDPADLLLSYQLRENDDRILWVAGCSYAAGFSLIDQSSSYANILSNKLNLELKCLSIPGTSIAWAGDQILRSDIRSNDIVIWGITGVERYMFYHDKMIFHVCDATLPPLLEGPLAQYPKSFLEKKLVDEDNIVHGIKSIFQVINFCKKIGAKLILFPHYDLSTEYNRKILTIYLKNIYNTVVPSEIIDHVGENLHPGPNTHKNWANELYNFITQQGYYTNDLSN